MTRQITRRVCKQAEIGGVPDVSTRRTWSTSSTWYTREDRERRVPHASIISTYTQSRGNKQHGMRGRGIICTQHFDAFDSQGNMLGGGGGSVFDRNYVLDLMHGRSRMTIDPRNPTMPGRSMSGFHRPGRSAEGGGILMCCLPYFHLTIDHASLSRRSTVPTPNNRDTSNNWAVITLFPYGILHRNVLLSLSLPSAEGGNDSKKNSLGGRTFLHTTVYTQRRMLVELFSVLIKFLYNRKTMLRKRAKA